MHFKLSGLNDFEVHDCQSLDEDEFCLILCESGEGANIKTITESADMVIHELKTTDAVFLLIDSGIVRKIVRVA